MARKGMSRRGSCTDDLRKGSAQQVQLAARGEIHSGYQIAAVPVDVTVRPVINSPVLLSGWRFEIDNAGDHPDRECRSRLGLHPYGLINDLAPVFGRTQCLALL
ncbi:hypothetical protein GCM10010280_66280 [Streptomyces pilosus]|uniref:Uncharacterized protein n=1 Tax=Streptomyces pilosus TaxID=28893 RepID=A0A918C768_9ACTN|nr:hypothetical protein GCM10010280_66280 [Streptomyces pilosus]